MGLNGEGEKERRFTGYIRLGAAFLRFKGAFLWLYCLAYFLRLGWRFLLDVILSESYSSRNWESSILYYQESCMFSDKIRRLLTHIRNN